MELSASWDRESRESAWLSLDFANRPDEVARARSTAREFLKRHEVDERARYGVELALDELLDNTLRHGYAPQDDGRLSVELLLAPHWVTLELIDDARPFDPTRHPEPRAARSLSESSVGGRGLSFVRAAATSMRYRRAGDRNHLTVQVPRRV